MSIGYPKNSLPVSSRTRGKKGNDSIRTRPVSTPQPILQAYCRLISFFLSSSAVPLGSFSKRTWLSIVSAFFISTIKTRQRETDIRQRICTSRGCDKQSQGGRLRGRSKCCSLTLRGFRQGLGHWRSRSAAAV